MTPIYPPIDAPAHHDPNAPCGCGTPTPSPPPPGPYLPGHPQQVLAAWDAPHRMPHLPAHPGYPPPLPMPTPPRCPDPYPTKGSENVAESNGIWRYGQKLAQDIYTYYGLTSDLQTAEKSTAIGAINELWANYQELTGSLSRYDAIPGAPVSINTAQVRYGGDVSHAPWACYADGTLLTGGYDGHVTAFTFPQASPQNVVLMRAGVEVCRYTRPPVPQVDYHDLLNIPTLNGTPVDGDRTLQEFGIASQASVDAKYTKPPTGIPAGDLSTSVQQALLPAPGPDGSVLTSLQGGPAWQVPPTAMTRVWTLDTASLSFAGEGTPQSSLHADIKLSQWQGNAITLHSDGIYVSQGLAEVANVTHEDSETIHMEGNGAIGLYGGTALVAYVKFSQDAGNQAVQKPDGVYVARDLTGVVMADRNQDAQFVDAQRVQAANNIGVGDPYADLDAAYTDGLTNGN